MQRTKSDIQSWLCLAAFLLIALIMPAAEATADSDPIGPGDMQTGSLLLRMANGYSTATQLNTDVRMNISGLVARVSVRQEFTNDSGSWVEGVYVFPLPDKAAVDQMRLRIGERFIEGDIEEKEKAKKIYEEAKQEGKKASLVEQQRANLFTTSVANIAPGETVIVEIEYLEDVRFEAGQFSIRFPMTLTPRYISGQSLVDRKGSGWAPDTDRILDASLITPPQVKATNAHKITLTATVNAGVALELIASRYHPVTVSEAAGRYTIEFNSSSVAMDHDFEMLWRPIPSASPRALSFTETIGGKPHYLLMIMPPDQAQIPAASMPRETIFIVDTSGSMHGVSMTQAKEALQLGLKGLNAGDLFNVIEFNSVTTSLFRQSRRAITTNVQSAEAFVRGLKADGGTEMRPALNRALQSKSSEQHLRQIVFITDGSVGYEDEMFSMIEQKLGDARLFTVGIGSAPNSLFMRKAAEAGRGSYTFISALHEVSEKMSKLFVKIEQPQVTNIDVAWPSGVVAESYPTIVPDLYLGEPVSVRVAIDGEFDTDASINVSGDSVQGAWTTNLPVHSSTASNGVAALWARARIESLMDDERRGADAAETRSAIVATAMQHHLVSKHTSLVAVDKTPVRPSGDSLLSEQVPNLLPYGQSANAIFGFPATATDAPMMRLTGIALVVLGLSLAVVGRRPRRRRAQIA